MTELEKQAWERVCQAGVRCDDASILAFIRALSPQSVLAASLEDILAVANAF